MSEALRGHERPYSLELAISDFSAFEMSMACSHKSKGISRPLKNKYHYIDHSSNPLTFELSIAHLGKLMRYQSDES